MQEMCNNQYAAVIEVVTQSRVSVLLQKRMEGLQIHAASCAT